MLQEVDANVAIMAKELRQAERRIAKQARKIEEQSLTIVRQEVTMDKHLKIIAGLTTVANQHYNPNQHDHNH